MTFPGPHTRRKQSEESARRVPDTERAGEYFLSASTTKQAMPEKCQRKLPYRIWRGKSKPDRRPAALINILALCGRQLTDGRTVAIRGDVPPQRENFALGANRDGGCVSRGTAGPCSATARYLSR